jgi:uncharacterized protein
VNVLIKNVIDMHVHFPAKQAPRHRQVPPAILEYQKALRVKWREQFKFEEPEKEHPGDVVQEQRWLKQMEDHQLQHVNFLTGGGNEKLAALVKRHPDKFTGFAHHDLSEDGATEKLQVAVEQLGLHGYKWFGPLMKKSFDAPELKSFWTYLADRKLPCLIHFGVLGGPGGVVHHPYINPLTMANVVQTYVDIPFIFPHFGAGYWQELLHLAWSSPNVHVDGSGSNDWIRWMPYTLTLQNLFQKAYETIGPSRIVFGSDSSDFPRGFAKRYLDLQESACHNIGIPKADMQLMFGGNAARILQLKNAKPVIIE